MSEIMAKINNEGSIELINAQSTKISADAMMPIDAAWLARGLLACAAALSGPSPPDTGAVGGDAHLPVLAWKVGASDITGQPVLILSIPPGLELTFEMPTQGATAIGNALIAEAGGTAPLGGRRGTVH